MCHMFQMWTSVNVFIQMCVRMEFVSTTSPGTAATVPADTFTTACCWSVSVQNTHTHTQEYTHFLNSVIVITHVNLTVLFMLCVCVYFQITMSVKRRAVWVGPVSTRLVPIIAAAHLLWCWMTHSAPVLTPPTFLWVSFTCSACWFVLLFPVDHLRWECLTTHWSVVSAMGGGNICTYFPVSGQFFSVLLIRLSECWSADENLSVCWQQVTRGLMCQSLMLGPRVTFMTCCCFYGEGWGMQCALCPSTDSGNHGKLHHSVWYLSGSQLKTLAQINNLI